MACAGNKNSSKKSSKLNPQRLNITEIYRKVPIPARISYQDPGRWRRTGAAGRRSGSEKVVMATFSVKSKIRRARTSQNRDRQGCKHDVVRYLQFVFVSHLFLKSLS